MISRTRMWKLARGVLFAGLGLIVVFFGSAFLSAVYEVATTLREDSGESSRDRASKESAAVQNLHDPDRTPTARQASSTALAGTERDKSSLHLDMKVNPEGSLTVTETLFMPKLEKKLPAGGGYTRTLLKVGRDDFQLDVVPTHDFKLDLVRATCDGQSVPYHPHDAEEIVRFCVDPPEDSDPIAPHVYTVTYTTTRDLYFPVWSRFHRLIYAALYNQYEVPIDEVSVRVEFPEEVVLSLNRVDAWTGRGDYDRLIDLEDWRGNTREYEATLDAPNVVSLRTTGPLYDSESFVFRVYFPRGSVDGPINSTVILDFAFGCFLIVALTAVAGSILYLSIFDRSKYTLDPSDQTKPSADREADAEAPEKAEASTVKHKAARRPKQSPKPISRAKAMLIHSIAILVMAFGVLVAYQLTIYSLLRRQEAKSWHQTPCRIVQLGHALGYDYEWEGRTYSSSQYDLGPFGRGLDDNFQKIKEKTPIGSTTVCYVNPADPSQAILSHELRARYFFGLGAGGFIFLLGLGLFGGTPSRSGT